MERLDGFLQALSLDEPHGVIGASAAVGTQAVDRHDTRVLQPAGDLGLGDEPLAMALLDRVVDSATIVKLKGKSYRMHRGPGTSEPS